MAVHYPPERQGGIERTDYAPQDIDSERVIGAIWSQGHKRIFTIERRDGEAFAVLRGTGGDVVWWTLLPNLKGWAVFALAPLDRTTVPRPHLGGRVMMILLLVQQLDAGKQEEWRNYVTDFVVEP